MDAHECNSDLPRTDLAQRHLLRLWSDVHDMLLLRRRHLLHLPVLLLLLLLLLRGPVLLPVLC